MSEQIKKKPRAKAKVEVPVEEEKKSMFDKVSAFFSFKGMTRSQVLIQQHDLTDCGAACLASICAYYGLQMPISRIRQYASTDKKGTNLLGILEAAKLLDLSGKAIKGPIETIYNIPYPSIAHVIIDGRLQHYVVVYGADKKKGVKIMDPAKGTMEYMPIADFKNIWTGIAVLLAPIKSFKPGDKTVSVLSRFNYLLQPHKSMLTQIIIGAIIYTVLGLSTSMYLQKIIDQVLPDGNQNLLNLLSLIMVGILVINLFINYTKTILTIKTGQQIDARLILGYYKHLLRLPQTFFDTMRVGEIISRMNDAVKIRAFINDVLISVAVNIFIVFFSFALMFTSYWKLAIIMLTVIPLYAAVYYYSNLVNKRAQRKLMEDGADLEAQLVESVTSIGTIKRFGIEDFADLKTETRFIKLLKSIFTSSRNSLKIGNFTSFISGIFTIILLWAGASFVMKGSLTAGELLSFYALVGYFTSPVISLIGMNKTMQDAMIAADRLFEIMDLEVESAENKTAITRDLMGDIVFKDIHFRYGTRVNVFEGMNLTMEKGKISAVIGESGSGKTTLLSLLQNIYPLQSGNIYIGGLDLKYITNDSLRQLVSVVPQQVDLFTGTVIENIAVGEFEPDIQKVIGLCKELDILDFIESLPEGFSTHLGENGANLSGGQRQRLAIARALYRDPEILILDEATSALDSLSERNIQNAVNRLRERGKTILLIAHRLSTVMNADKIIVMLKGDVKEEGTHVELLAKHTHYYKMWEQQFPMIKEMEAQNPHFAEAQQALALQPVMEAEVVPATPEPDAKKEEKQPIIKSAGTQPASEPPVEQPAPRPKRSSISVTDDGKLKVEDDGKLKIKGKSKLIEEVEEKDDKPHYKTAKVKPEPEHVLLDKGPSKVKQKEEDHPVEVPAKPESEPVIKKKAKKE